MGCLKISEPRGGRIAAFAAVDSVGPIITVITIVTGGLTTAKGYNKPQAPSHNALRVQWSIGIGLRNYYQILPLEGKENMPPGHVELPRSTTRLSPPAPRGSLAMLPPRHPAPRSALTSSLASP